MKIRNIQETRLHEGSPSIFPLEGTSEQLQFNKGFPIEHTNLSERSASKHLKMGKWSKHWRKEGRRADLCCRQSLELTAVPRQEKIQAAGALSVAQCIPA